MINPNDVADITNTNVQGQFFNDESDKIISESSESPKCVENDGHDGQAVISTPVGIAESKGLKLVDPESLITDCYNDEMMVPHFLEHDEGNKEILNDTVSFTSHTISSNDAIENECLNNLMRSIDEYMNVHESLCRDPQFVDIVIEVHRNQLDPIDKVITFKIMNDILMYFNVDPSKSKKEFLNLYLKEIPTVIEFLGEYPAVYQFLPDVFKTNQEITLSALSAFNQDNKIIENIPQVLWNDEEFIRRALSVVHSDYKSTLVNKLTEDDILLFIREELIDKEDIDRELLKNLKFTIALIEIYNQRGLLSDFLSFFSSCIKDNQEVFIHLIKMSPDFMAHASNDLLRNFSFMLRAISINPDCMIYADETLKQDNQFVDDVYQLSERYMLELIAKATIGLGVAGLGLVLLTQAVNLPLMLLVAATISTGLCMAGFFAEKIYANYHLRENNESNLANLMR